VASQFLVEPRTVAGVTLTPLGDGVVRVSWEPAVVAAGFDAARSVVRAQVEEALAAPGVGRVDALVDPDDLAGARVATWSGLHREGVMRGAVDVGGVRVDRVVFARLRTDAPIVESHGFRAVLNSFLPRKRAIGQMLVRDPADRVLLCRLTYKRDLDLPGGVVEVGESPRLAVSREISEELGVALPAGDLVLTDWLPAWSGWDDAVCLVFDGGVHHPSLVEQMVLQPREIISARFYTVTEARDLCADFTVRRIEAALTRRAPYTESGRPV
jgi:ADP-ribose pyrophosphatase YjhB (NUDIX family)